MSYNNKTCFLRLLQCLLFFFRFEPLIDKIISKMSETNVTFDSILSGEKKKHNPMVKPPARWRSYSDIPRGLRCFYIMELFGVNVLIFSYFTRLHRYGVAGVLAASTIAAADTVLDVQLYKYIMRNEGKED